MIENDVFPHSKAVTKSLVCLEKNKQLYYNNLTSRLYLKDINVVCKNFFFFEQGTTKFQFKEEEQNDLYRLTKNVFKTVKRYLETQETKFVLSILHKCS